MTIHTWRIPLLSLLLAGALVTSLVGCGSDVSSLSNYSVPGAAVTVHMIDSPEAVAEYQPSPAHVRVGQTVAFVNAAGDYHTVTFTSGPEAKSSAGIKPGGTFETTFHQAGVYRYRCLYHNPMMGEIDVTNGPTPFPSTPPAPPSP